MLTRSRLDAIITMPSIERQQQEVVLALVVVALLDVVRRHQDDHVAGQEEQRLHDQREVVHHVGAAEHDARPSPSSGQRDDRDEGAEQRRCRRSTTAPTSIVSVDEEVDEQDDHDDRAPRMISGSERVVVERRAALTTARGRAIMPAHARRARQGGDAHGRVEHLNSRFGKMPSTRITMSSGVHATYSSRMTSWMWPWCSANSATTARRRRRRAGRATAGSRRRARCRWRRPP